jgi:hypothetical protein
VKQFADWVTRRGYRAGFIAAALALVPLLGVAGSGLLVLTSLRRSSAAAWVAAVTATLVLLVASVAGGAGMLAATLAGLVFWAPAVGLAEILKRTGSFSVTVQVGMTVSLLMAGLWSLASGGGLSVALGQQLTPWLEARGFDAQTIESLLTLVPGTMAMTLLIAALSGLLLGMWWHAALSSPGALAQAFRSLRLGRVFAVIGMTVLAGGIVTGQTIFANLMVVVLFSFALQGLALIHAIGAARSWPAGALALLYVMLFFGMSVVAPLLAVAGILDNWLDFRGRLAGPPRV